MNNEHLRLCATIAHARRLIEQTTDDLSDRALIRLAGELRSMIALIDALLTQRAERYLSAWNRQESFKQNWRNQ
jgi:hypothetical protein